MSKLIVESNLFINEDLHFLNSISATIRDLNDKVRFNFFMHSIDTEFEFNIIVLFKNDNEDKDIRLNWNVDEETSTIKVIIYNSRLLGGAICKTFGELMYIATIDNKKIYAEIQIDKFNDSEIRMVTINLYEEI